MISQTIETLPIEPLRPFVDTGYANSKFLRYLRLLDAFHAAQNNCRPKAVAFRYRGSLDEPFELMKLFVRHFN